MLGNRIEEPQVTQVLLVNPERDHIPLWLKLAWSACIALWIPIYWRQYGPENFLWFCDLGNLIVTVALWTESPLLFSMQACGLLIFQTLFCIDLAGALATAHHLIGGTEYMFDPHLPVFVRLLSLFHLVMPPLLIWAIWRLGYHSRGWIAQTVLTWVVCPICYFWHPERDVNWVRGWGFHAQSALPGVMYLLAYLVIVPLVVYYPTHLVLKHWLTRQSA
jgi:hypothetical protein